jgi:putative DNA methylase
VPLREYLEQVWAAVSKEALTMIFKDADTAGLEPDARLTAMWLWTLGGAAAAAEAAEGATEEEADEEEGSKPAKAAGFVIEFDAARKIAQGLGIHLEKASSVVEVKGETARLLSVAERTKHLFGKEADDEGGKSRRKKKEPAQKSLFAELEAAEKSAGTAPSSKVPTPTPGATVLDQVHQAMILFAAGRGEAMKRFLVEDGVGKNAAFWKLAQSLSALYPPGGDEKRWVDGVLARKKGLGL